MLKTYVSRLLQASLMCCIAVLFAACDGAFGSDDNPMSQIEQKFSTTPLTMEALSAGTIVIKEPQPGMQYALNGGPKMAITSTDDVTIDVAIGDKVKFYGNGTDITSYFNSFMSYTNIAGGTADVKLYGNIMSLVDETGFAKNKTLTGANAFRRLFFENTHITDASGLLLPATTLSNGCYSSLFLFCSNLTAAPKLPALELVSECYGSMFAECSSLTTAPELPATTLAEGCYSCMFAFCTSLTTAPVLPATTLFKGCYFGMFSKCANLTATPELPAPTLANLCYYDMFSDCPKLSTVTCLATDISAFNCTLDWLLNTGTEVTGEKTFYKAASMTGWGTDESGTNGWTVKDYTPAP